MRTGLAPLIGVMAAAVSLIGATEASALSAKASLVTGMVKVSGRQASRSASISWEGVVVTAANRAGRFGFTTAIVPADCIGTLTDGTSSIDVRIEGCSGVAPGLPATGQTVSYAAGDDGDVQAGGPLSYTDNGDGTVTDIRTGLTWEMKTDTNVNETYWWEGALDYVAQLNTMNNGAGFAGHNDWRLPNVKELLSIVDYGRFNPSIDPIFGPTAGTIGRPRYWSSTSWAAYYPETNAWAVDFGDGYGNFTPLVPFGKNSSLRVRAVRGGF